MRSVKIFIDDVEFEAKPGQTIMEAADQAGIAIARLCNHPSLKPSGSCRLCAVEIEGYRGLPAACTTPVAGGMSIRTNTPKVLDFRREMLRMILQEHPRQCLGCPRNGTCELQQLVAGLGIDFPYAPPEGERLPPAEGGAYFVRDYSLCVRCGRCVRVCHEVRGAKAIVFRPGDGRQEVGTPLGLSLAEAGCEFCGSCLDVCPVGALRERLETNDGEPFHHMLGVCANLTNIVMTLYRAEASRSSKSSVCPICAAACAMDFDISEENEIIQVRPSVEHSGNRGHSCIQGRFLLKGYLRRENRLLHPLVRNGAGFEEKEWKDALRLVAEKFSAFGPNEVAVLSNDRLSNENLFLLRKFAAEVLNTELVWGLAPEGGELAAGGFGGLDVLGKSDCILTFGLNPPATHPVAGVRVREAVMGGAKLVTAGPCETATARYADIALRHYPGAEPVLISGLFHLLMHKNRMAEGDSDLRSLHERLSAFDPATVSKMTGVSESDLVETACLLDQSETLSVLFGAGVSESPARDEILTAIRILMEARKKAGKKDGTVLPALGAGNFIGQWAIAPAFGASQREAVRASGKVKAVHVAAENTGADALASIRQLTGELEFVLFQDTFMPGRDFLESLPESAVLLPLASVLETGGTFACSGEKCRPVQPILPLPGRVKQLPWVLGALSLAMGVTDFEYEGEEAVLRELRDKVPFFADSGAQAGGNPSPLPYWDPALLSSSPDLPDERFPFALAPKDRLAPYFLGPLLAQETSSLFDGRAEIEMNPADLFPMGLLPGETVRVVTRRAELEGRLGVNRFLIPKMVAVKAPVFKNALGDSEVIGAICAARIEKR